MAYEGKLSFSLLSSFFFRLFPFSPIPFSIFGGFGGVGIGYLYCGGAAECCKATLLLFVWGLLLQNILFSFFSEGHSWGLLIQNERACNVLGVVNDFDWRSFALVQTGGR